MGAFMILVLGKSAGEAWSKFKHISPKFMPFRDASQGGCSYQCTILHCLRGLDYAIRLGWFSLKTFDLYSYDFYERVENGDMNWIIPGKFLAFSGPSPK